MLVTQYLGLPLTSQKIVPGNVVTGIAPFVYKYMEHLITFTGGGTTVIAIGTVVQGATSKITGIVISTPVITGAFANSDAAGSFRIKASTGTWTADEKLTVAAEADAGTMVGSPQPMYDRYRYQGMMAKAAMISVSGNTALMSATSTPDQTYLMGHSLTVPSSYVLYSIEEIRNIRFVDFASGSASVINVTCFF